MNSLEPLARSFAELLTSFGDAVQANDGQRLAALFSEDGVYEDGFFGAHTGRAAIAAMLQRFHDTGSNYLWEFVDPVSDGAIGYAGFRFSYTSRVPESMGDRCCSRASAASGFAAPWSLATPKHSSVASPSLSSIFRPNESSASCRRPRRRKTNCPTLAGISGGFRRARRATRLLQHLGDLGGLGQISHPVPDVVGRAAAGAVGSVHIGAVIEQKAHHLGRAKLYGIG